MGKVAVDDIDDHIGEHLTFHLHMFFHYIFSEQLMLIFRLNFPDTVDNLIFTAGFQQIMPYALFHGSFGIFKFVVAVQNNELCIFVDFMHFFNQIKT